MTDKSYGAVFSAVSRIRERVSACEDPHLISAYNHLSASLRDLEGDLGEEREARDGLTEAHAKAAAASYKGWRLTRAGLDVERDLQSLDDARSYAKQYKDDLSSSRASLRQQAPWEELLLSVNNQSTSNIIRQAYRSANPDDDETTPASRWVYAGVDSASLISLKGI
ncbi:hypothetical protein B9479_005725 [Cryptococcus floricola]|uniref:Uncharacterized protein n=1 Tax=Cryptococcus floricola TaxID=2591691 RepID=A0A5D3ASF5_9TREE|nr:hypothetical protein B9479_005725 [Cryptococcus floricola]